MPLNSTIIHPDLFTTLNNFWVSTCVIQTQTLVANSIGETIASASSTWATLTGHGAIKCNLAADKFGSSKPSEYRAANTTYDSKQRFCQLDGYYPLITEKMRAVVGGVTYNIKAVIHLSIPKQSKLILEVIT